MGDWKEWAGWLQEGHFISYYRDGVRYYEHIIQRDLAHYVYTWPEIISPSTESGPYVPANLEVTRGYDTQTNTNRIWQVIFGIYGQVYIYVELPTDIHRHGLPKLPKPGTDTREISHFEEWMSPYHEPSFVTEHIMLRPETYRIALSCYNPEDISLTPKLNFIIAKLTTERIGTVQAGDLNPVHSRFREVLDKLYRRVIPHRPLTLLPVRAPAEAPAGQ